MMNAYVTCRACGHRDAVEADNPPPWCRKCGVDRKKASSGEAVPFADPVPSNELGVSPAAISAGPPRLPWETSSPPPVPRSLLSECVAERPMQFAPPSPPPLNSQQIDDVPVVEPIEDSGSGVDIALPKKVDFFDATLVSRWGWRRKYRVFVTREDLLLIELMMPDYVNDRAAEIGTFFLFGGGLLGWWLASSLQGSSNAAYSQKVHLDLLSQADLYTLRGMAVRNRNNLRVIRDDVYEMSLETPSMFHRIAWMNFRCAAVLRMRHCLWGDVTLQVETYPGLMLILRELPHLFGDRLEVAVEGHRPRRHKTQVATTE